MRSAGRRGRWQWAVVAVSLLLALLAGPVDPAARAALASQTGDADRGAAIFSRACAVCHSPIAGLHKEGPSLAGVYGRRAGSIPFFTNYKALRGSTVVWDEPALDAWLADPQGFTGRASAMTVKLADPQARADVIAYLKTLE